ncbi:MAG: hypothetical protein JWN78_2067 [Bacteroidota bacterium]|nr:hypothetical protein [Bacteroidota bacterium]
MNNLIIAALTFIMLPALTDNVSAKSAKNMKEQSNQIVVEKMNFTGDLVNNTKSEDEAVSVDVDYIIAENGKAYITYINAQSDKAKSEVVRFIESSTYDFNIVPGKVYSMKLTLTK